MEFIQIPNLYDHTILLTNSSGRVLWDIKINAADIHWASYRCECGNKN